MKVFRRLAYIVTTGFATVAPVIAYAQRSVLDERPVQNLFRLVVDPAVRLMFAVAVLYFVFGVFTYIRKSDDSSERLTGANHILWSTVGLFIMVSVWGIIAVLKKTIGS